MKDIGYTYTPDWFHNTDVSVRQFIQNLEESGLSVTGITFHGYFKHRSDDAAQRGEAGKLGQEAR